MLGSACSEVFYSPAFSRAYALPTSSSVTGIRSVWKFSTRGRFSWSQTACCALQSCRLAQAFGPLPYWNQRALAQVWRHETSLVFAHSSHCLSWFCWVLSSQELTLGMLMEPNAAPSPKYKKWHHCIASALSGFLALTSDSTNILRISSLQPLSRRMSMFSSKVLWNLCVKT